MLRKIISGVLATMLVAGTMMCTNASADTGSYHSTDSTKNSTICTSTIVDWSNNGNGDLFWGGINEKITGKSSTLWLGSSPFNADTIVITNEVSCEKILGSFSVTGGESTGAGVGISSDSTSKAYTYSISNDWKLDVNFSYIARVSGLWLIADIYFETSSTTQLGSSFYVTNTGYHHISK